MPTLFSPLVENALRLANYWHKGQKRKEGEFDYFTHPVAVALMLSRAGFDDGVIAAGLCHDLLEDTDCPAEELSHICGPRVLHIVETVTEDISLDISAYWEERKQRYIEAVRKGSVEAKAVCTADKIHNLQTLISALEEHGMEYFRHFHRGPDEKLWFEDNVCMMLQDTWDHPLVEEYNGLVDQFADLLEKLDAEGRFTLNRDESSEQVSGQNDFDGPLFTPNRDHEAMPSEPEESYISETRDEAIEDYSLLEADEDGTVENQDLDIEEQEVSPAYSFKPAKQNTQKPESTRGAKYLTDPEIDLLMPAVLQLGIAQGNLTNTLIQEHLKVPFSTAFRMLKELKRLHIINRADSFVPRKVNVNEAKSLLQHLLGE